jgi:competence protein ComEC
VVALTHADHDHIDGLNAVLANFRVGELWVGRDDQRPALQHLLAAARSSAVSVVYQSQGAEHDWHGAQAEVLWPPGDVTDRLSPNDASLVLRLVDGQVRFLLAGDIEKRTEEKLVEENAPVGADFLKSPHHGSKTSSTEPFLAAVAPRVASVSVGEANPFGHPSESVLERYGERGVQLLRTDRDGAITASTDGTTLSVRTFAGPNAP